jgi:hypothetical protein
MNDASQRSGEDLHSTKLPAQTVDTAGDAPPSIIAASLATLFIVYQIMGRMERAGGRIAIPTGQGV